MSTVAGALVAALAARGVDCVFGIPGVHTIGLYRGLAGSGLRHVTPRHEQGAGFMADGYARASGRLGVAFVITGPGLTNTLTAMAQARADSVPMLVVSGVNATRALGRGMGYLHELPDQSALAAQVALGSWHIREGDDPASVVAEALALAQGPRPGPVHIELPLDLAEAPCAIRSHAVGCAQIAPRPDRIGHAVAMLSDSLKPLILVGGGARHADVAALAERLDAPVVQTVNARGLMHGHRLSVPASPSLAAVRQLMLGADVVLALGTELGPTDYDMYASGSWARPARMIRVDSCQTQLSRHPADLTIAADVALTVTALCAGLPDRHPAEGGSRAARVRAAAWAEIGPAMQAQSTLLAAMRDAVPGALIVGDSTQPVYAGNLWYDHDRPGGWFNAATGYGALGYAIPAAIGAAIARPDLPVICLTGDGGAQFTLPELMVARQENLPVTFVIWNNAGYAEIADAMRAAQVPVIGCDAAPPDFADIARACALPHRLIQPDASALRDALSAARAADGPSILEIDARDRAPANESQHAASRL